MKGLTEHSEALRRSVLPLIHNPTARRLGRRGGLETHEGEVRRGAAGAESALRRVKTCENMAASPCISAQKWRNTSKNCSLAPPRGLPSCVGANHLQISRCALAPSASNDHHGPTFGSELVRRSPWRLRKHSFLGLRGSISGHKDGQDLQKQLPTDLTASFHLL